ncbi:MAG: hypothetical protein DMD59_11725 [Gemmatimonadetes bacterium]|nr:MAG: hypothetical protein DMD59_11725 [Gemmatimonadota bacterium]
MLRWSTATVSVLSALLLGGCNLNVENPNAPDAPRAFLDPAGLEQLLSGAVRTWVETRENYYVMPLNAQADNYTASWNNAAMRFYSSVGSDCPIRCGWNNSVTAPEAAGGPTIEALWYGYYSVLASANNVLIAANRGICFDTDCSVDSTNTMRDKTIATMLQGMALAGIALVYDQGFFIDEKSPVVAPPALPFISRAELRDSALKKFDEAYALAGVAAWDTPPEWMGVGSGTSYSSVDTRVAALITTNHQDPWPNPSGNPCPTISPDARVGDGTYGPSDDFNGYATTTEDAGHGTDYACSGVAIFPPARGSYHQSNLQHKRYHELAYRGEDLPTDDGTGQDPLYTPQMSDLLWAEGLLRSGGSAVTAAGLINNSRVGRGNLTALTGAEGLPALITALQYEQEIEFMGQGVDPFFNRRRSGYTAAASGGRPQYQDGLVVNTPRQMPVPAKELTLLQRALYSFGGPSNPDMSAPVEGSLRGETVQDRFRALQNARPGYLTRFLASQRTF